MIIFPYFKWIIIYRLRDEFDPVINMGALFSPYTELNYHFHADGDDHNLRYVLHVTRKICWKYAPASSNKAQDNIARLQLYNYRLMNIFSVVCLSVNVLWTR